MTEHVHSKPLSIDIAGMTCASCVARVDAAVLRRDVLIADLFTLPLFIIEMSAMRGVKGVKL